MSSSVDPFRFIFFECHMRDLSIVPDTEPVSQKLRLAVLLAVLHPGLSA